MTDILKQTAILNCKLVSNFDQKIFYVTFFLDFVVLIRENLHLRTSYIISTYVVNVSLHN